MTTGELYQKLAEHRLGVLGTTGADGQPQGALVGIAVTPRLDIIFDTVTDSRKYANLTARPACSFTVGGWGSDEITIQYEGVAELIEKSDLNGYLAAYLQTWPDGVERLKWPGIAHFVVHPRWIRLSDFGCKPAAIREFVFQRE